MLDFLLVLGQVPGTKFYFTFAEILLMLLAACLIWEERLRHKQVARQVKYYRKRSGVNYRKAKRKALRLEKKIKKSRLGNLYVGVSLSLRPSSRH